MLDNTNLYKAVQLLDEIINLAGRAIEKLKQHDQLVRETTQQNTAIKLSPDLAHMIIDVETEDPKNPIESTLMTIDCTPSTGPKGQAGHIGYPPPDSIKPDPPPAYLIQDIDTRKTMLPVKSHGPYEDFEEYKRSMVSMGRFVGHAYNRLCSRCHLVVIYKSNTLGICGDCTHAKDTTRRTNQPETVLVPRPESELG